MKRSLAVLPLALFAAPASAQFNDKWASFVEDPSKISSAVPISDASVEVDLAWGDLDNDGRTDVVAVRKEPFMAAGARTNVLLMNEGGVLVNRTTLYASASDVPGDQGFLTPTTDRDVAFVDVDFNGILDVVTACDLTDGQPKHVSHPRVYYNLGSSGGSWLGLRHEDARIPQLLHATSGVPLDPRFTAVTAADFDHNGWIDLYFGDQDEDAGGGFGSLQPASEDTDDRLLRNPGAGFFQDASALYMTPDMLSSIFCNSVAIGDFNLDGTFDVLKQRTLGSPWEATVAYNDPLIPGVFGDFQTAYVGSPYFVSPGDLNRDGRLDFVVSDNGTDKFLLNQGNLPDGTVDWSSPKTYEFLSGGDDGFGSNSVVTDVDKDGWNDVLICDVDPEIAGYNRRLHVYHNRGGTPGGTDIVLREERESTSDDGWIGFPGLTESDLMGSHDVAVFDLDLDGDEDVVISRLAGTTVWLQEPPPFCQADLGFGDGSPVLEVCGGDLSTGNGATLRLINALANRPGVLAVSATAAPFTLQPFGVVIVPAPPYVLANFATDPNGEASLPVAGGGGPSTFAIQAFVLNGEATLFNASNGVEVQFLP